MKSVIADFVERVDYDSYEDFHENFKLKYDEDYNLIHVWFSTTDNDEQYLYLGCVNKFDLEKYHGVSVIFAYKD